jgi:hypothetical protein
MSTIYYEDIHSLVAQSQAANEEIYAELRDIERDSII